MNSNSHLIIIHFKIYKIYLQLTEINLANINIFVLQVNIIFCSSNLNYLN